MLLRTLVFSALVFTLTACNFSGTTEKGPFLIGSTVTASKLNGQALPISSTTLTSNVLANDGGYSIDQIEWSGWAQLQVTGQFFDEFSGSASSEVMTLNAVTRKDRRFDTANIHLFSHFAAARIRQRVANGQNRGRAWRDTQSDMKQIFGLSNVRRNVHRGVEQLSLSNGRGRYRKENANLLLFTGSFLATGGDATTLAALTIDFADDGQFNGVGADIFNSIAIKGGTSGLLTDLSNNLTAFGISNPPNDGDMPSLPRWVIEDAGDSTPPVITVVGDNPVDVEVGSTYLDQGATAFDNVDGEVVANLTENSDTVDTSSEPGTTFTIEYEAIDIAGNRATATRTVIIILGANQVPVADDQTVPVDEDSIDNPITLTGTDGDEDVLSFDIVIESGPDNGTLSGEAPDLLYTPDANFSGTDSFEFTVNDGTDTSAPAVITMTVNPVNDAPTADAGTDVSVPVNETVTLEGMGSDVDGDELTYSWSEGEIELATTSSFDYTPETGGTHTLTLSVSDGTVTTTDEVVVEVTLPDSYQILFVAGEVPLPTEPPRIEPPRNFDSELFTQTILLIVKVIDGDGNPVFDEAGLPLVPDFDTATVDLTSSGLYNLEFSVIDPFHGEITRILEINVVNFAPIATGQSISVDEDSVANPIILIGVDANQGDTLTFERVEGSGPNSGTLSGTAPNLTYTPNANFDQTDSFSFRVSDGEESSIANINITVNGINDAPTVTAGADETITEGDAYTPTQISNDIDGTIATTVWTEGGSILTFPKTDFSVGVHTINVTVTDNGGLSASDVLIVTVNPTPNTAPVANNQTITVDEDSIDNGLTLVGTDADGDALTYTTTTPSDGILSGTAPNITYTPFANFEGSDSFTFTVSDGTDSSTAIFTVNVTGINDLPTANAGGDTTVQLGTAVVLTGSGTDIEDGSNVSFSWIEVGNEIVLSTSATFSYTPMTEGSHTLTLTVTDSDGGINSDTVIVVATAAPIIAPTANAGVDSLIQLGDSTLLDGSASSDSDGSIVSYQWSDNGAVIGTGATLSYTPTTAGIHVITLTVTDNDSATATDTVSIDVNAPPTVDAGRDKAVHLNNTLRLSGSGNDTDGTIQSVSWTDNGLEVATTTSFTYSAAVIGVHNLTLTVVDNRGATASDTISVTVEPANIAPTVNAGADVSVEVNSSVLINGSGTDSDGTIVEFLWTETIDGVLTELVATVDINYSSSVVGEHILTLFVIDDDNAISTDTVTVTVTEQVLVDYACLATLESESTFVDSYITEQVGDIAWSLDGAQSPTVAQIENAFNVARDNEVQTLGPLGSNLDRTKLKMPEQAVWDGYTDSQKALFLINSERCARGIRPYEGIAPEVVASPAQTYAQYLADNDVFGHQEDGRTPWQRLAEDAGAVVGITADFFSRAENLAFVSSASTGPFPAIHEAVTRSIYSYMYADKGDTTDPVTGIASYGHRVFVLATGLIENSGVDNQEGLIGVGKAEIQSVVNFDGVDFNQTKVYSVMNGFDPNSSWNMSNVQSVDLIQPDSCLAGYTLGPILTVNEEIVIGCIPELGTIE